MFTYFQKKQVQKTSNKQKDKNKDNLNDNQSSANNNQNISNVMKLPSEVFQKLLNSSAKEQQIKESVEKKQWSHQHNDKVQIGNYIKMANMPQVERQGLQVEIEQGSTQDLEKQYSLKHGLQREQQISEINKDRSNRNHFSQNEATKRKQSSQAKSQSNQQQKNTSLKISQRSLNEQIHKILSVQDKQLQDLVQAIVDIVIKNSQLNNSSSEQQSTVTISKLQSRLKSSTLSAIKSLNSQYYQSQILQTKQKFNNLVQQSTNIFMKSRRIANLINEFIMSINLFLESQQLLIPCEQINKSISQLNPQRTEKYINYLIKIFQANFQQVIQKRLNNIKSTLQSQLRKQQKLIKQQEGEVKLLINQIKSKQSTYYEQTLKYSEKEQFIEALKRQLLQLKNHVNMLQSTTKQSKDDYYSESLLLKRQLQRAKRQSQQSTDKINRLTKLIQKKDKIMDDKDNQIQQLGSIIKKVKEIQDEGMDSLKQEMDIKQRIVNQRMQKFSVERLQFQNKIKSHKSEVETIKKDNQERIKQIQELKNLITNLKQQITQLKQNRQSKNRITEENAQEGQISNAKSHSNDQNTFENSFSSNQPNVDLSKLVNKQILGHLFMSFDDESKQWAIRNNIRNQIHILLDIKKGSHSNIEIENNDKKAQKGQSVNKQQQKQSSIIGKLFGW